MSGLTCFLLTCHSTHLDASCTIFTHSWCQCHCCMLSYMSMQWHHQKLSLVDRTYSRLYLARHVGPRHMIVDNHARMVMLTVLWIESISDKYLGLPHGSLHMLLYEYHELSVYNLTASLPMSVKAYDHKSIIWTPCMHSTQPSCLKLAEPCCLPLSP